MKKTILALLIGASGILTAKAQVDNNSDLPGSFTVDIGLNILNGAPGDMGVRTFGSRFFNFYYTYDTPITKKFLFSIGLGIGSENYSFKNNITLAKNTNLQNEKETLIIDPSTIYKNVAKSKISINYLDIPIEFRFRTDEDSDKGLKIAIGGKVGLLIDSHTKINYNDNGPKKVKLKDDFNLSTFRYGVLARVGYGNFSLFGYYGLNEVFKNGLSPQDKKMNSLLIGISIGAF